MIKRMISGIAFNKIFNKQMRFIIGPRQAGKTTVAKEFLKKTDNADLYYNWDFRDVKNRFYDSSQFYMTDYHNKKRKKPVWCCFDEIHKMPKWKNILKEAFDANSDLMRFIITGSARLDLLRHSGDSLTGRYFTFKLLPLSYYELSIQGHVKPKCDDINTFLEKRLALKSIHQESYNNLLEYSGFPDPFLKANKVFHKKWHNNYIDTVIREDLRELSKVHELEKIAQLMQMLPNTVGNPLSLNSLRNRLEVSHTAIRNYMKYLDLTYIVFSVYPYSKNISRSIKKEAKFYFYDWTYINEKSARFENFIAMELKSLIATWNEIQADNFQLFYIRTKDKKETDFLITRNEIPWILFEVKMNEKSIASHNYKHSEMLNGIPLVQLLHESNVIIKKKKDAYIVSADRFLSASNM